MTSNPNLDKALLAAALDYMPQDDAGIRRSAQARLADQIARNAIGNAAARAWQGLLDLPPPMIAAATLGDDTFARMLRETCPVEAPRFVRDAIATALLAIPDQREILVIDFEASGFKGWPIEVALGDPMTGAIWSSLIRPDPSWDAESWSLEAECVHGISRELLEREGRPAGDVGQEMCDKVGVRWLITDNDEFDNGWLTQLAHAAQRGAPPLHELDEWLCVVAKIDPISVQKAAQQTHIEFTQAKRLAHRAGADVGRNMHRIRLALGLPPLRRILDLAPITAA